MKHILVYGDSNTWGWDPELFDTATGIAKRYPYEVRWTSIAQKELGPDYRIIEDALNGRTFLNDDPYYPHRVGMGCFDSVLDAQAPLDLVIIMLGCNELKHMFGLSAGMIVGGLDKIVAQAKQSYYGYPAPQVLVISPAPTTPDIGDLMFGHNFGPDCYKKSLELSPLYKGVAAKHGVGFLDGSALGLEINPLDGLHYSKSDHAKLAAAAVAKIKEMLG